MYICVCVCVCVLYITHPERRPMHWLGRESHVFAGVDILIGSRALSPSPFLSLSAYTYIHTYMYTYIYIYIHVYTYVHHTSSRSFALLLFQVSQPIFPAPKTPRGMMQTLLRVAQPSAAPLLRSFKCPAAFSNAWDTRGVCCRHTQGMYRQTQGDMNGLIWIARVHVRVGMKTVMTALAWLYIYMCMYIGMCLAFSLHIHIYTYI